MLDDFIREKSQKMRILYRPHCYSQQRQRQKKAFIYPIRLAMESSWYMKRGHYVWFDRGSSKDSGYDKIITDPEGIPFLELSWPHRVVTGAFLEKYQRNGNFKYRPGTYILSASGCWWGQCVFCVEKGKKYEVREVSDVIAELEELKAIGFKEVFDDSATFPDGKWLTEFCIKKINSSAYDLPISCNMRIGADVDFKLMKRAGFRMLLYGIESGSQETLNKIKKGVKKDEIIRTIQQAKEAGLAPHVAVMFGYPWEEDRDRKETIRLVHFLLRKGYAETAQASIYRVGDTEPDKSMEKFLREIFKVAIYPDFWWNKIKKIRTKEDFAYLLRQIKEGIRGVFHV